MSKRGTRFALTLLVLWAVGCAKDPFQPTPLPRLDHPDPAECIERFARTLPDRFTSDDTLIIHAPFRDDMAMLGVVQVDRAAGTFELLGLNHMGVQFFHLSGDRTGSSIRSAVPPLMKQKKVLLSIADDTRRMYFDLLPTGRARSEVRSNTIRFSETTKQGTLIHIFGGDPGVLLEKRLSGFLRTQWRVRYFEHVTTDGKQHPGGIVLSNSRYHYRITVRNREWQAQ